MTPVARWELYWVRLEPVLGSEQGGERPALILSNDGFNAHFPVVTIVPLTGALGKGRRIYPFEVHLPRGAAGNREDSIVMPQQVRTVSKMRLGERIGILSDRVVQTEIENRLLEHLGIAYEIEVPH
jgi:mRNA interferase MazF